MWQALVKRVDGLAAKLLNTTEIKRLWIKVDPENLLNREWLLANQDLCVPVLWGVVWGLKIALHVLGDSDKAIDGMNFLVRNATLQFIKSQKNNIVNGILNLIPEAVHLVFDNIPQLRVEAEPFIKLARREVNAFQDIKGYVTFLKTLHDDLDSIFKLYEGKSVDTLAPKALIELANQVAAVVHPRP